MNINKLSKNQFAIILALEKYNEIGLSSLQKETGIAKRTLIDNLNKLVKEGLIVKAGNGTNAYYKRNILETYISNSISVFKEGKKFGNLYFGNEGYSFKYDANYKGDRPSDLIENIFVPDLFPEFENLIPEYERRRKLQNEYNPKDLAELLVYLKNTHGAYDFIYSYEENKYQHDYSHRPNWLVAKKKILDENRYPNVLDNFIIEIDDEIIKSKTAGEHSHLSGNQNKIDINIDFENKSIKESKDVSYYLLKPYNEKISDYFNQFKQKGKGYYPHIAINEHLFMSFAKNELNFDVPYTALIKGEKEFHYIVKRYDRLDNYKYHQKDFAQYLGISSDKKYNSTSEELFIKINEVLYNKEEKLKALKFYFYSNIIKHADLHTKNIGALNIGKDKHILTPLYDVISVGIYYMNSDSLGLPINYRYKNQRKQFKIESFYGLANILGIKESEFKKEAKNIILTFLEKFPNYIESTKELLKYDSLKINSSRIGHTNFIIRMSNFYNEKITEFLRLGILKDLNIEYYRDKLKNENLLKYNKHELDEIHKELTLKNKEATDNLRALIEAENKTKDLEL